MADHEKATITLERRKLLKRAASAALGVPLLPYDSVKPLADATASSKKLTVVVAGAHPDDPESGCGGTMARYSDLGHEVYALYLTRGEAGIPGKSHAEAARIRTAEAEEACKILGARPLFAGQIDGSSEVTNQRYADFRKLLESIHADIVFTHWPIDTHRDHRATSLLVFDAWLQGRKRFALYYFEVLTGEQTSQFWPTHYVDITATEPRKRAACYAHRSQNPDEFYGVHDKMNRFRGMECGCAMAEALIRHAQSRDVPLPDDIKGLGD